jgi:four helix bundle protein
MKYSRFEELPVWRDAVEVAVKTFALTANEQFKRQYSLRDQIERAAVSVSNNIAEGFERGTTQELLTFLYIARGSAGEVKSMLCLFERFPMLDNLKSEISDLKSDIEGVSKQLRGWANSLQNSGIRGQRYLNDKSRLREKNIREREEFLEELRQMRTAAVRTHE